MRCCRIARSRETRLPEITIELSLSRSSGVLAGIVGTLARTGIELRRQTLKRDEEGKGGWLAITGEGTPPAPAVVAENLNATRVVDRLLGMVLDGEAVLAQGVPLDDQLAPADPAERYAGSDAPANAMNEETIASEAALPGTREHEDTRGLAEPDTVSSSDAEPGGNPSRRAPSPPINAALKSSRRPDNEDQTAETVAKNPDGSPNSETGAARDVQRLESVDGIPAGVSQPELGTTREQRNRDRAGVASQAKTPAAALGLEPGQRSKGARHPEKSHTP